MPELLVSDWNFLRLSLDELGPFRQGLQQFDFFGVDTDDESPTAAGPANLYMLLAKNAYGKTTILDTMYGLFGLLNSVPTGRFADISATGRAQLDIRASWTIDGRSQTVLLSLWTGSEAPLYSYDDTELDVLAQAKSWARLGLKMVGNGVQATAETNELGTLLLNAIQAQLQVAPTELFGLSQIMPTVLYFPADRRVVAPAGHESVTRPTAWGYQPAQIFSSDGPEWGNSVDNILVWLEWLADRRTDKAEDRRVDELLAFLNDLIFRDDPTKYILPPQREELRTFVQTRYGVHPLAALSHGERALLQILGRTLTHMTSNTVILIDEIEIHLHTRWMNRMFESMKELLRKYQALSMIFTTHNRELIQVFSHQTKEEGLVKGGHLIENEI